MPKRGVPLRQMLTELLRRGLDALPTAHKKFHIRAKNLGVRPGVNFECIATLLNDIDRDRF